MNVYELIHVKGTQCKKVTLKNATTREEWFTEYCDRYYFDFQLNEDKVPWKQYDTESDAWYTHYE